jgi:3-deoxy-D-manno-octulosonate 8-phosphate phosphatase (KDO 8-P phosphatase)
MPYRHFDDLPADVRARAARIKLAVFDVDGTLTDGSLHLSEDGHETKVFHVHDGLGLKRLHESGVQVAIVTARISHTVALRADELGIEHVYQGQHDKRTTVRELIAALHIGADEVAFVGDDLPDLAPMRLVGLAIAVANAHPTIAEHAHWRTRLAGGHGAGREVSDMLLAAQGKADAELERWL